MLRDRIDRLLDLVEVSPLPCIVTCRPHWEGGEYHGDDDERIALFEALGTSEHPPAYIDVELATYTRSKNIRQKINLAVNHPKQVRAVTTRLILSSHGFEGRPSDPTRKIIAMQDEPACSVIKIAYRARSIRDNLELFEILADRQKPTIALCMGEFGLMSRILAPKFGGFLTFASLRDESTTAPGQPTIDELLNLYRFRSITPITKVYGIIGWPVTQSMSPMVHNAGFEKIGWDGVYVPMPVEGSYESFKATMLSLIDSPLDFTGASVTIPHKQHLIRFSDSTIKNSTLSYDNNFCTYRYGAVDGSGSANTIATEIAEFGQTPGHMGTLINLYNTDSLAVETLITAEVDIRDCHFGIVGAGGVAKGVLERLLPHYAQVSVFNRSQDRAQAVIEDLRQRSLRTGNKDAANETTTRTKTLPLESLKESSCDFYINCTPVGMVDGPDPDGMSIPVDDMDQLAPETVFFDTVYNPIETPMLKAAKERGYRTIDGVQMFVKQAQAQFEIWTGASAPDGLFDSLVREKLST